VYLRSEAAGQRVLVPAGREISIVELPGEGLTPTLEHDDGRLLYSGRLSWEDLQSRDFRIVFDAYGLAPLR
jgi:hypothetical protein